MAQIRIPKDYEKKTMRSVHNRSCIRRTTMHPGLMIPIYSRRVMAGEKLFIDPVTVLQTNALIAPLMGSFRLQLAVFFDSDSNYYGWMDNNARLSTHEYLSLKRHRVTFRAVFPTVSSDFDYKSWTRSKGVQPSSIWNYFGFPMMSCPVKVSDSEYACDPQVDLGFFFTYLNIFRNYYCNNQEDTFPVVDKSSFSIDGQAFPFSRHQLKILDKLFREVRFQDDGFNFDNQPNVSALPGMNWFRTTYLRSTVSSFGGLLPCTYQPDLMTNLLNISNNVKSYVRITTSGAEQNTFTIDTLRFQNKLQRLIDRLDVSGGRFSNWLRAVWGVRTRKDMDIPELIGVTQKLIDPTELTAKSNSEAIGDVDARFVGDLAGNFNKTDGHRGHSFYASTPGRVMVIATLVPNVDYTQGLDYEVSKVDFADDYVPEFSQLGFQSVPLSRYSFLPSFTGAGVGPDFNPIIQPDMLDPLTTSVGKQVAWLEEMTDVNRNFGEFDWNGLYNYWVLNRRYSLLGQHTTALPSVQFQPVVTQYINPLEYQYPFVMQTIADPNWFLQVGLRIKAVRPIGKRYMPNLE